MLVSSSLSPSLLPPLPGSAQLPPTEQVVAKLHELNYQGLFLCHLLVQEREEWIADKPVLVDHLRKLWTNDGFHSRLTSDSLPLYYWKEGAMCLTCLLQHCK